MTNISKWLIALPFTVTIGLLIPAAITGNLFWFLAAWTDTLYVILTISMWLIATAFVDVSKPRGKPDMANLLISTGLILSVPLSVLDKIFLTGNFIPGFLPLIGVAFCLIAIVLGLWARSILGQAYSPRGEAGRNNQLVTSGPYRIIRHPLYTSACLWAFFWPLMASSLVGALFTSELIIYAVHKRIGAEEQALIQVFGDAYLDYRNTTWRLIPYLY